MSLDLTNADVPYLTGRLFAVLEEIQKDSAGGSLNKTIKDSYFASACATPGTVFPRLIILAQNHLAKLSEGTSIYYGNLIGDITDKMPACFPKTLSLEEQGEFIIGYYHQNKALYTKKENNSEEK